MKKIVLVLLCLFILTSPFLGRDLFFFDLFLNETTKFILFNIRIPKVIMGSLVGASLAIAGWVFQILFRNPLATPYTLGVSSVAAFTVALSELLLQNGIISNRPLLFIFAYIPLVLLIALSFIKRISRERLLLIGVSIGVFSSSAIIFIQSLLGNESVSRLVRWMMGSLEVVGYSSFYTLAPIVLISLSVIFYYRKELVLISIGEIFSQSRGVDLNKVTFILMIFTNLLVGVVVWFCGPIGFIGLIIPHFMRGLYSSDFSKTFFPTLIYGASFLVLVDLISRLNPYVENVSIGAITAIIGAPLLIFKIVKN